MNNKRWKLYEYINKHPDLTGYELSKRLEYSIKKIKRDLKKLIKEGLIERVNTGYKAISWKRLINWDEMDSKPEDYKLEVNT